MRKPRLGMAVAVVCGVAVLGAMAHGQEPPTGFGAVAQYRFGVGARALALGAAFTAVAEGVETLYWNPAGLARESLTLGGMYTEPYAGSLGGLLGLRVQYVGGVVPYRGVGLGGGWFNVHVSEIPYTNGDEVSYFDYDSSVFLLGFGMEWAFEPGVVAAVGATGKLYREQMLDGAAQGLGFDLGLVVELDRWRLAYCSQDVGGTRYRWSGTGQQPLVVVPWVHRLGASGRWVEGVLSVSAEVVFEEATLPSPRLGVEGRLFEEVLALRGGVRLVENPGKGYWPVWTLGFGVAWEGFLLDAAYLRNPIPAFEGAADLSTDTYVISVGVRF